jgi:hypothetical protein
MRRRLNIEKNKQSKEPKERDIEESFKRRRMRLPDLLRRRPVSLEKTQEKPEREREPPRELLKPPESLPRLRDKSKLLCKRKRMLTPRSNS